MNYRFSSRGLKDLEKTSEFYIELYGEVTAKRIIVDIFDFISSLSMNEDIHKIGVIDPQFENHQFEYRKVFFRYLKINYRVSRSTLFIMRVFDSR
ncbi:type II toxin-antitoxin system RelE/ParE family toxin [Nonlabens ponticola]|uniref:Type II toxin-antitoxin system RelE/ParE family toxin n=1 Tax=Nonlabens ponticola TaxID=2496866 RepID=A0A3S9MUU6_9FLAO|nr:type II toxin-antitoxin system RelE/ParE family toxin [Nonlabens ponticola]AZQ42956.1 type II toxin-antitoxin system RelE/ParE family toxin [Nonlabens ponticola]